MTILDQLIEKKDLRIYIDMRIKHLQRNRRKMLEQIPLSKRDIMNERIKGRILELANLRKDIDQLKDQAKKYWAEHQTMLLRDVLPMESSSAEFNGSDFRKYLDHKVIEEIHEYDPRFPFTHKNIYVWWILEDGIAVGWNENPARGWSFPVARVKDFR